jgi:precorrin-6Y C5,15-methyltransferase (decarboxylating)
VFEACWAALRSGGRLVVNAVTLETEEKLFRLFAAHRGSLNRIAVSRAEPVGSLHGWRPAMPVMQWTVAKP